MNTVAPGFLGEIEFRKYPTSEKTLTPAEAEVALANERAAFGSSICSVAPDGSARVLVGEVWYNVKP